jgi:hypothetical protein
MATGRKGSVCASCVRQKPATCRDEFFINYIVKVTLPKFHTIMKPFCFAAALIVLTAGCASRWSPPNNQTAQPSDTDTYVLHTTDGATPGYSASSPPRLSVGVSYPDTQLILPWFLNDIIGLINYR